MLREVKRAKTCALLLSFAVQILAQVYDLANGKDDIAYYGMGGSIPIVALLKKYLDMETTMFGFALADDNMHAPNEFWREECLRRVQKFGGDGVVIAFLFSRMDVHIYIYIYRILCACRKALEAYVRMIFKLGENSGAREEL